MFVYIFVTPEMADEKTSYILANSKNEALTIYCRKYNEDQNIAKESLTL